MKRPYHHLKTACSVALCICLGLGQSGCESVDKGLAVSATMDLVQASTLTDQQIASIARGAAAEADKKNTVAPPTNAYAIRLNKLMDRHRLEDGLTLNFKVFLSSDVNAFAMADGSIRVFSGLMDKMSDDELRFVLGHEIGHVKKEHSKRALQVALSTSAARKGLGALGGTVGELAASDLGALATQVIRAQYSQKEELAADNYGLKFMRRHNYPASASVSALRKLGASGGGFLSTHPNPQERASRIERKL